MQKNQGIAFTQSDIWLQAPWKNCNNDEKQHQAASGSQPTLIYLSASYLQIAPHRHVNTIQVSLMDEMPLHATSTLHGHYLYSDSVQCVCHQSIVRVTIHCLHLRKSIFVSLVMEYCRLLMKVKLNLRYELRAPNFNWGFVKSYHNFLQTCSNKF